MSRFKAVYFFSTREFVRQTGGPSAPEAVLAALTPEDRVLLDAALTPESWVEYGALVRYLLALDRVLGLGDLALVREATKFVARRDLNALARVMLSLASPKFVANSIPLIWRQYWDEGSLAMHWTGPKAGYIELRDFSDMPAQHEVANNAFIEELLRLSGCRNMQFAHPFCLTRGDDHCRFEIRWE